jgi:hypothetical protein
MLRVQIVLDTERGHRSLAARRRHTLLNVDNLNIVSGVIGCALNLSQEVIVVLYILHRKFHKTRIVAVLCPVHPLILLHLGVERGPKSE